MFSPLVNFYGATAIYLSSHFLIHVLSSNFRVPFLHSEWLCWSFLLLAANLVRPSSKDDDQDATTQSDKLALAIAAVCAFRTIGGVDWALVCPCDFACLPTYWPSCAHSHCSRPCPCSSYTKLLPQNFNSSLSKRLSLSEFPPTVDSFLGDQPRPLPSFLRYCLQLGFYQYRVQHGKFAPGLLSPLSSWSSTCWSANKETNPCQSRTRTGYLYPLLQHHGGPWLYWPWCCWLRPKPSCRQSFPSPSPWSSLRCWSLYNGSWSWSWSVSALLLDCFLWQPE